MTSPGTPPGLCAPWDPIWPCALPTSTYEVTGTAVQMASEILWGLTARRFGLCEVTLRPCRRDCFTGALDTGGYPSPALVDGRWYNIACGDCTSSCSCTRVSEVILPGPVHDIVNVKINGVTLVPSVDYRLDDFRILVRLGGSQWPLCNDLNLTDDQSGTWSVTLNQGEEVPTLGRVAVGTLGLELAKSLVCDSTCMLPKPVQSLSRQGINITFLDPNEIFATGRTGLYVPDLFISTYNPNNLRRPSRVYDIDRLSDRRVFNTG